MSSGLKKIAVAGKPIFHSKSPDMFNQYFSDIGINAHYSRIAADDVGDIDFLMNEIGIDGLNITMPFKSDIIDIADEIHFSVKATDAANTIVRKGSHLFAANTDIYGVENSIRDIIGNIPESTLIIGSGNAASAAACAMNKAGSDTVICGRNIIKATVLSEKLRVSFALMKNIKNIIGRFDLIISTLPPGIDIFDDISFSPDQIILEAAYKNPVLKDKSEICGAKYINGKEWLLRQAESSARYFLPGKDLEEIRESFRTGLGKESDGKNIYLIGFMASGKTTIGKKVAKALNKTFFDIDKEIEKQEGIKISEIFEKNGEDYFRNLETEILGELSQSDNCIIACGGGTQSSELNRKLINSSGRAIWLYKPFERCMAKAKKNDKRPLAKDESKARELFEQRQDDYFLTSDLIVNAARKNDDIIKKILSEIA